MGFYAQGARNKWKMSPEQRRRSEDYRLYQEYIRVCARFAGIKLPLEPSKSAPLSIHIKAWFESGVHCDPGNVQKAVSDALCYGAKYGDKYTGGSFPPPNYDKMHPRVEVTLEGELPCESTSTPKK